MKTIYFPSLGKFAALDEKGQFILTPYRNKAVQVDDVEQAITIVGVFSETFKLI